MREKIFTLCLALATSVGTMFAEPVQIGELYYDLDAYNKTATVTTGNYSALTEVNIPSSVIYDAVVYSVTRIGDDTFGGCTCLTSIEIPSSVVWIGESAFYECTSLKSITIPNSVTHIGEMAFYGCTGLTSPVYNAHLFAYLPTTYSGAYTIPSGIESIAESALSECEGLTSVKIPNSVTTIGAVAFYGCTGLTSVTIPSSVTRIDDYAFYSCTGLTSITCEAVNPPALGEYVFYDGYNFFSIPLYVHAGSVDAYKADREWKTFSNILPIAGKEVDVTVPVIEPEATSAEIAWPIVSGAASYELIIKDANGKVVCTLTFNAQGQLTAIVIHAPARNEESQQTQSTGFAFTVTGLEPGTQYNYSIIAKNESGATINTKTGSFTTLSPEGIYDVIVNNQLGKGQKILHNGQFLILQGDHIYTLTGQEVR